MEELSITQSMPHSQEAEEAILASMFLDREAIFEALQIVHAEDFYIPAHKVLFRTMVELNESGEPIDLVTLTEKLRTEQLIDEIGGVATLARISNAPASSYNVSYYAKIVDEKATLRQLIKTSKSLSARAMENAEPLEMLLDDAEKGILDISQQRSNDGLVPVVDVVEATLDRLEDLAKNTSGITGVPSGFVDLDRITNGWQKSDFIIVAARPAMGKTAFCLNMATNAAIDHQVPVAIFSLEMGKEQLVQRMISSTAEVDQEYLRTGKLPHDKWPELVAAIDPLARAPIYIDDTPAISVRELRAKARRLQTENRDLGLIIIDYLQLMQGVGRPESRQQEVSEISRSLKSLARELNVPVIALSQLSRSVEQTRDKRPALSHLRESGSLEQDADLVLFIYREEYYEESSEKQGIAEISIAKHRNGATGAVELSFRKELTKFGNLYHGDLGA